jgi:methionine biosynthesis protein MetW
MPKDKPGDPAPLAPDSPIIDSDSMERMSSVALEQVAQLLQKRMDPALLGAGVGKFSEFLTHVGSAKPRSVDEDGKSQERWQDDVIVEAIPEGVRVLDLGCGEGELLARLIEQKGVRGQGVEIHADSVMACVEKGVPVIQSDLDEGLKWFPDKVFDVVVMEETLQTLSQPGPVLDEMLRVGQYGIVSFPNFGYWRVRLDLVVRGRMPVTEWLPYGWHDTPNIHLLSLQDFLDWSEERGVEIVEGYVLSESAVRPLEMADNLYAEEALLFVRRD